MLLTLQIKIMDRFTISILVLICVLSLTLVSIEYVFHQPASIGSNQPIKKPVAVTKNSDTKMTDQISLNTVAQKLFQAPERSYSVEEISNPNAEPVQINPETFNNLAAGQEVEFLIPQQSRSYTGIIEKVGTTSNGLSRIATGQLIQYFDSVEPATFSIISDDQLTFITIRTGSESFQIEFNTASGKGYVKDLQDLQQSEHPLPDNESDSNNPELISPSPQGSRESFFES